MEKVKATRIARGVLPGVGYGAEGTQERTLQERIDPVSGATRDVAVIVRPHGIADMHARGRITDRQKSAADRFAELYELAHTDGVKAIDYSKLRVDGSMGDLAESERKVRAIKELARIEAKIGKRRYGQLVRLTLGDGVGSLAADLARTTGRNAKTLETYVSMCLIESLDDLDEFWNVAVGAGVGIRADAGEVTTVHVALQPVDIYAHMTKEELQRHGREVMAALKRMVDQGPA